MPPDPIAVSGEGPRLAFVPAADAELVIAENMVAFANTEGGIIIVGLQADGAPAATRTTSHEIDRVLKQADDLYSPPVVIESWEEAVVESSNGRVERNPDVSGNGGRAGIVFPQQIPVHAIRVPRSTELHALADGRVLIRSGKVNRPLGRARDSAAGQRKEHRRL